jgi:hypothetical protein
MMNSRFSTWAKWGDRNRLDGIGLPGVYVISLSKKNISGNPFKWTRDIIYIGMTNDYSGTLVNNSIDNL